MNQRTLIFLVLTTLVAIVSIIISNPNDLFSPPVIPSSVDSLHTSKIVHVNGAVGPESLVFDSNGEGPYTGVADGRVLKWLGEGSGWIEFATTSANR